MKTLNSFPNPGNSPPLIRSNEVFRIYSSAREKLVSVIPLHSHGECEQPFYLDTMFRGEVGKNYRYRQKNLPLLGMEYVREGSLIVRQEERYFLLEPGDIFLIQPQMDSELMTGPDGFCVKDSVSIRGKLLNSFLAATGLEHAACLSDFDWRMLEQLLERIQEFALKNKSDDTMTNSLLAYELLECLAFSHQKADPVPKLARLKEFMQKNLSQPLTLHDLAKQYGSSESTLLQTFRAVYGKTPHAQLIELRMEQAAKLLLASPWLSIKEVADQSGYSNSMNFSTAFRRSYGMSPRAYRKLKFHSSYQSGQVPAESEL